MNIKLLVCLSALISINGTCLSFPEKSKINEAQLAATEPGAIVFTPPQGWKLANPDELPPNVKVMVVGSGSLTLSPSISLATEDSNKTLAEYLKIVKEINASKGAKWINLGKIQTQAGEANLSQVDSLTKWGTIRMMHVILAKNGTIYILTAAALKEEFPQYKTTFLESLRSLRFNSETTKR